jgi:creatinine amidohydrolase
MDRPQPGGIRLFDLPYADAARLCATGAPVYLTVNPVEYHGPHLSHHNDRLMSEALIERVHPRLGHPDWPLLLAGDLEIGVDPCPGPGSRWTPLPIARALVREACRSLQELGARRVVLMTFHGAPLHNLALYEAVGWLQDRGVQAVAPFNAVMQEMLSMDPFRYGPAVAHLPPLQQAEMMDLLPTDFHAGFFETSIALYLRPDTVAELHRDLPPCPKSEPAPHFRMARRIALLAGQQHLAQELAFAAEALGWMQLRPFPGYTSRPDLASAQAGAVFVAEIVSHYAGLMSAVFAGRQVAPPPIMSWLATATLAGRIPSMSVPSVGQISAFPQA